MGTYGMVRFCVPLFPEAAHRAAPYVAVLAIIGILYGALVAMVQTDLKRLVAYSSVSHLGFVVLGIFAFTPTALQGALYQMINHGISTGALFVLVGTLYDRRHTYEIREYGGLATPMPVLAALFLFVSLSSAGLPMLNGFVGEFLILLGTFERHAAWAGVGHRGHYFLRGLPVVGVSARVLWRRHAGAQPRIAGRRPPGARHPFRPWPRSSCGWVSARRLFTRRTEASARNVLQLMHRPQAYNARGGAVLLRNPSGASADVPNDVSSNVSSNVPSNVSADASSDRSSDLRRDFRRDFIPDVTRVFLRMTPEPPVHSSPQLSATGAR